MYKESLSSKKKENVIYNFFYTFKNVDFTTKWHINNISVDVYALLLISLSL